MSSFNCPANNGHAFFSGGQVFDIHCGINFPGSGSQVVRTSTAGDCVARCTASGTACIAASWDSVTLLCSLSNTLSGSSSDSSVWTALLSSAQQPTCSQKIYHGAFWTAPSYQRYSITCPAGSENGPTDDYGPVEARSIPENTDEDSDIIARGQPKQPPYECVRYPCYPEDQENPKITFKACITNCDQDDTCKGVAYDKGTCQVLREGSSAESSMWLAYKFGKIPPPATTTTTKAATSTTKPPTTFTTLTTSVTTTTTTTTTAMTTTTTTTTRRPTPTSGPCPGNTWYNREYTDAQGIEWGICDNAEMTGSAIEAPYLEVPSTVSAAERPEYCARKCGNIRGCVATSVQPQSYRAFCNVNSVVNSIYATSSVSVALRKDPPVYSTTGPCAKGFEAARTYTTANGAMFALCPNNAANYYWAARGSWSSDDTDKFVAAAEKCSQSQGCNYAMFGDSDYLIGVADWSSKRMNADAHIAIYLGQAP